jgi:hypothetical protein
MPKASAGKKLSLAGIKERSFGKGIVWLMDFMISAPRIADVPPVSLPLSAIPRDSLDHARINPALSPR